MGQTTEAKAAAKTGKRLPRQIRSDFTASLVRQIAIPMLKRSNCYRQYAIASSLRLYQIGGKRAAPVSASAVASTDFQLHR
jgi:hypothetical protein